MFEFNLVFCNFIGFLSHAWLSNCRSSRSRLELVSNSCRPHRTSNCSFIIVKLFLRSLDLINYVPTKHFGINRFLDRCVATQTGALSTLDFEGGLKLLDDRFLQAFFMSSVLTTINGHFVHCSYWLTTHKAVFVALRALLRLLAN